MILNRVQHESGENTCLTMLLSQAGHQQLPASSNVMIKAYKRVIISS